MGKARVLGGGTDGLYQIEILEDRSRAEAAKATALNRMVDLNARIAGLEFDLSAAQDAVNAAAAAQDQAIADYQAALTDDQVDEAEARQEMLAAGEALTRVAAERDAIRSSIRAAKTKRLAIQSRVERINALPPIRQIDAWCADYVEDLSGEVATAEVPGEIGQVIIQPGFADGAAWSPSEDGAIQPALSGTPASVFYNLAMLPGWQKWRPTFRIATVSNIDSDLCDIALEPAASSQQGLNVNAQASYAGVPIMYMDCDGEAFEEGDRALVAFSGNTGAPIVVGFASNPRECNCCEPDVLLYPSALDLGALDQLKPGAELSSKASSSSIVRVTASDGTVVDYPTDPVLDEQGRTVRCKRKLPSNFQLPDPVALPNTNYVAETRPFGWGQGEVMPGDTISIALPSGPALGWFQARENAQQSDGSLGGGGPMYVYVNWVAYFIDDYLQGIGTAGYDENATIRYTIRNASGSGEIDRLGVYNIEAAVSTDEPGGTVTMEARSGPMSHNCYVELGCYRPDDPNADPQGFVWPDTGTKTYLDEIAPW